METSNVGLVPARPPRHPLPADGAPSALVRARRCRLGLLALVLLGPGCTDPGDDEPGASRAPRTVFRSEGLGPANVEPLGHYDLGGQLMVNSDDWVADGTFFLGGPGARSGRRVWRSTWSLRGGNAIPPDVGDRQVDYYYQDDTGQYHAGSSVLLGLDGSVYGAMPRPILVLPATVRAGMIWDAYWDGDDPVYTFEVRSRQTGQATIYGPATVWRIDRRSNLQGTTDELRYVEGWGGAHAGYLCAVHTVLPLTPQPDDSPATSPVGTLELLEIDGLPLQNFLPVAISAMDLPGLPRAFIVLQGDRQQALDIVTATFCLSVTPAAAGGDALAFALLADPADCLDGHVPVDLDHLDGAGVFEVDGLPFVLPRDRLGHTTRGCPECGIFKAVLPARSSRQEPGILGHALHGTRSWGFYRDWRTGAECAEVVETPWSSDQKVRHVFLSRGAADAGAVLLRDDLGHLAYASYDGTALGRPTRVAGLAGPLSTSAWGSHHETYRVTPDGLVDRVAATREGISFARVAHFAVPAGHHPLGVVALRPERAGTTAPVLVLATWSAEGDRLGAVALWRLRPAGPEVPWRPPASTGVSIRRSHASDVEVCWPPTDEPLTTEGWLLGGAPPARVIANHRPGASCVLLVRDQFGEALPCGCETYRVEGPVPGVGRIRGAAFLYLEEPWYTTQVELGSTGTGIVASLRGGGFMDGSTRWGPGGYLALAAADGMPGGTSALLPDASGLGMWVLDGVVPGEDEADPEDDIKAVGLAGHESHRFVFPELDPAPGTMQAIGPSGGGGVLVHVTDRGGDSRDAYLGPDGSLQRLPATLPGGEPVSWLGRLADGTICGEGHPGGVRSLVCRDPQETFRSRPAQPDERFDRRFLPVDDTTFLYERFLIEGGPAGVALLIPATLEIQTLSPWLRVSHHHAPDGRLLMVLRDPDAIDRRQVARVTTAGLTEIEVPSLPGRCNWLWSGLPSFSPKTRVVGVAMDDEALLVFYWEPQPGEGDPGVQEAFAGNLSVRLPPLAR